jgi:hypothetical protein
MIRPAPIAIAGLRVDDPMECDARQGRLGAANTTMTIADGDPTLEDLGRMKGCDGKKGSHALSRRCFWQARNIHPAISDDRPACGRRRRRHGETAR